MQWVANGHIPVAMRKRVLQSSVMKKYGKKIWAMQALPARCG